MNGSLIVDDILMHSSHIHYWPLFAYRDGDKLISLVHAQKFPSTMHVHVYF